MCTKCDRLDTRCEYERHEILCVRYRMLLDVDDMLLVGHRIRQNGHEMLLIGRRMRIRGPELLGCLLVGRSVRSAGREVLLVGQRMRKDGQEMLLLRNGIRQDWCGILLHAHRMQMHAHRMIKQMFCFKLHLPRA
jgi:hypothetical protein